MEKESVAHLNLFDLLLLLAKWWKIFLLNFVVVVLAAVIIALILPVWYSASSVILPPSGGGGGVPSFLPASLKGMATDFGLEVPTDMIYQSILNSRSLKTALIERFNLRQVYEMADEAPYERVLDVFESHFSVETRDDDAISVSIEDRNPRLAADISNACVEELDRIYRQITSETARNNRIYIGKRLQQITDSLETLQDSLMRFQESTRAISLSDQMVATITAAADVKAKQIASEVDLAILRNNFGESHPLVGQLEKTVNELTKHYVSILNGTESDVFIGLQDMPQLSREYADLIRAVRVQSSLIEYIYPQYENAVIQEQRESANVRVLDRAQVPQLKSRPPRRLIVMIAAAGSVLFTLVFVMVLDYWQTLPEKNTGDWNKFQDVIKVFRRRRVG